MKKHQDFKTLGLYAFAILVIGGIGGVLLERGVFPYLSSIQGLNRLSFFAPQAPIIINKREEIRIIEGINQQEVANRAKSTMVSVYVYEGEIGTGNIRVSDIVTGVIATSDGVIVIPQIPVRPAERLAVVFSAATEIWPAQILTSDDFTGLTFLKVKKQNLPVFKQGLAKDIPVGEKILAVWSPEDGQGLEMRSGTLAKRSNLSPSLFTTRDLGTLSSDLYTDWDLSTFGIGALAVNRDAAVIGVLTDQSGKRRFLRSEDLLLALNNFLDDQQIVWPTHLRATYKVLGVVETKFLGLPKNFGVLIDSAALPLRKNDFIYAINGRELGENENWQQEILQKKAGEIMKLKLFRGERDIEVEVTL